MNSRLHSRNNDWPACETIVIHTGLSVTVRGHLVDLDRDDLHKVATVKVSVLPGYTVTDLEQSDVKAAADLLARRAERFLGYGWKVLRWEPLIRPAHNAG